MTKTFEEYYCAVFDTDGSIKSCGRKACMDLIQFVETTYMVEVGNEDTGFISNQDLIKAIYLDYKKGA